jgi:hypothetical protein
MLSLALLLTTFFATQPPAHERIDAELTRLRASAGDALGGQQSTTIKDFAERSKRALERERLYLAVEELLTPWILDASVQSVARMPASKTLKDFEADWTRLGEPVVAPPPPAMPLALAAIASAAASRAPATWRASRPYAEDSGIEPGYYHLGEAHGWASFARFVSSLPVTTQARRPSVRPMAAAIAQLELETAKHYDKAPADRKTNFIPVNVSLKIARQLAAEGNQSAALYQYLLARYRLGVAQGPPAAAPDAIKQEIAASRSSLKGDEDHSLAELFLQRAEAIVDAGETGAANAALIVRTIVPEYLRSVQVTVTLVRWPFT